ncbi:MAG: hypothetical protein CMP23_05505 [Rickettsiales bacterium]|nr:hypothetical protein [Rickettsiales bacterium]|tara:strand:- start:1466 stop:3010 length:1545 start_codon:yes stop_codon:yes gene_type:complete
MNRLLVPVLIAAALAWLPVSTSAAEPQNPTPTSGSERVKLYGEARLRFDALTEFGNHQRPWWLSSRLLIGTLLKPTDGLEIAIELEGLNGQFAGPTTPLGSVGLERPFRVSRSDIRQLEWFFPRRAALSILKPKGRFSIGLQTFEWGSGMLSNDGVGDPLFGDARQGGVVARVGGTLTPWAADKSAGAARGLIFVVAGDLVFRDDNAHLLRGDLAFQGLGAALLKTPKGSLGLFATARYQRDREDPYHPAEQRPWLFAVPVDLYGKLRLSPPNSPTSFHLESELAVIFGRTTRAYGEETYQGSSILSFGGLLRAHLQHEPAGINARLDLGYASGDADPRDAVSRTFSMNSDHEVGLLLFEHVLPLVQASAIDRAADPELSGTPSSGLRHGVPQGGVHNAAYLYPSLQWRPIPAIDLRFGGLLAWAPAAVIDVYESARKGGYNTGFDGQTADARFYGGEVLAAFRGTIPLRGSLSLQLGVEGAVFLPGSVFDGLHDDGGRLPQLGTLRARADLRW